MYCSPENVFYSINNSILHGNDFSRKNTDSKAGKNCRQKKRKEKEPGSSGERRQYCIVTNWPVALYHGSFYINVFISFSAWFSLFVPYLSLIRPQSPLSVFRSVFPAVITGQPCKSAYVRGVFPAVFSAVEVSRYDQLMAVICSPVSEYRRI